MISTDERERRKKERQIDNQRDRDGDGNSDCVEKIKADDFSLSKFLFVSQ